MKRILMVDDVATNLICAAEVLKSSYDITMARSGKEALLLLKGMTPDLIMLDINAGNGRLSGDGKTEGKS